MLNQCIAYSGKETKYNMVCNTTCALELSNFFGTIQRFEHMFIFLNSYLYHLQQTLYSKLAAMLAHIVQNNVAEASLSTSKCMPLCVINVHIATHLGFSHFQNDTVYWHGCVLFTVI